VSSDDCPCKKGVGTPGALPAVGDPDGASVGRLAGIKKTRRPKVLKGIYCVVGVKSGKPFNCTDDREKAVRLADKLGPRFRLKKNDG
jgi:hypothetical protein